VSVYFVTCREANAVKIGCSVDPHARLPEIQWGCPLPLTLEAVMPGNNSEERRLHRWYADDRIHGEWFTITPMIELLMGEHAVPHETRGKRCRASKPRARPWHRKNQAEKYATVMAEQGA
jgi:hypothetical protein